MTLPESQSGDTEVPATENVASYSSAIKKQQAAQLLNPEISSPDPLIRQQTLPKTTGGKNPWLFLISLLIVLLVILLFRYQDLLLPPSVEPIAANEPLVENGQLQRQLDMARGVSQVLIEEPSELGDLVTLYRRILEETPDQPEALSAMQQLPRQCLLLVSFYVASGQWDIARQLAEDSLLYFPELADDPRWQQVVINIPVPAVELAAVGEQAEQVIAVQEPQVLQELELPVAVAPEPEASIAGTSAVLDVAEDKSSQLLAEPISTPSIAVGLSSDTQPSTQRDTVDRLLQEADAFNRKGIQFTQQENAFTRYQDVLAIEPGQADATAGLEALLDARIAYVKKLLSESDLDTAREMLEPALRYFPANPQLRELLQQLDTRGGAIGSLEVGFLPVDKMDSSLVTVGGQTLLITFSYKYFPTTTTVVNARLFSLPGLDTIAGVPIVLQDSRGSKSVQMNILSKKIDNGAYQLILSSGDKPLSKVEFSVSDNVITLNDTP